MIYKILADLTVIAHLAFIIFVLFGGLLCFKWKWFYWVHVPAFIWGILIEIWGWICPLTPLENYFYRMSGKAGYAGGFIEHYIIPIIYPAGLTRTLQFIFAALVILTNIAVYYFILARLRSVKTGTTPQ